MPSPLSRLTPPKTSYSAHLLLHSSVLFLPSPDDQQRRNSCSSFFLTVIPHPQHLLLFFSCNSLFYSSNRDLPCFPSLPRFHFSNRDNFCSSSLPRFQPKQTAAMFFLHRTLPTKTRAAKFAPIPPPKITSASSLPRHFTCSLPFSQAENHYSPQAATAPPSSYSRNSPSSSSRPSRRTPLPAERLLPLLYAPSHRLRTANNKLPKSALHAIEPASCSRPPFPTSHTTSISLFFLHLKPNPTCCLSYLPKTKLQQLFLHVSEAILPTFLKPNSTALFSPRL